MNSKALREERGKLAKTIKDMAEIANNENRDFTSEELEQWNKVNKDYDELGSKLERVERLEKIDNEIAAVPQNKIGKEDFTTRRIETNDSDKQFAFRSWFKAQAGQNLTDDEVAKSKSYGINPYCRELVINLRNAAPQNIQEARALSAVTGASGNFTIPEGFVNNLELALLQFGGMRQGATVRRVTNGQDLPWVTSNDTSNKGAKISENTAVSEQDVSFGQTVFRFQKYTSKLVRVPVELLTDSAFDLASELGRMLGERLGRIENDDFTTGTATPYGLVTASALGVTAASATAIAADEIFNLVHSVDPAYRANAAFMFHDNILLAIRKLKDGNGQYLWNPGLTTGVPDRLLNFPVFINQSMQSSVATGTKTMLFGAVNKYYIFDQGEVRLRRFVERYGEYDQEGYVAYHRVAGDLLDAGTNPVKHLIQA